MMMTMMKWIIDDDDYAYDDAYDDYDIWWRPLDDDDDSCEYQNFV